MSWTDLLAAIPDLACLRNVRDRLVSEAYMKKGSCQKWKCIRGTWISEKPILRGVWMRRDGGHVVRARVKDPRTARVIELWKVLPEADADEALHWLLNERQRIRSGTERARKSKTLFADFAVSVFQRKADAGDFRSASGVEKWRVCLARLLASRLAGLHVEAVIPGDLSGWREDCARAIKSGRFAPSTMNTDRAVLSVIFKQAKLELGVRGDLLDGVRCFDTSQHPTYSFEEPNSLTSGELKEFLSCMRESFPQHYAMTLLGFVTGKRPSTLRPLRRQGPSQDVRWDDRVLLFRRSNTHQQEVMLGTKTRAEERVQVPQEVLDLLRWHVRTQLTTDVQKASMLLFPSLTGAFRARSVLDKPFEAVATMIGLQKRITPRGMRRTFQDLCREAQVGDLVTRSISGHATAAMQARYSTVLGNEQEQGICKVIRLITPATRGPAGGEDTGEARRSGGEGRR
jgi:hypothetical protein